MVSLRRLKNLGLCSGIVSEDASALENEPGGGGTTPANEHPMALYDLNEPLQDVNDLTSVGVDSSNVINSNSNDRNIEPNVSGSTTSQEDIVEQEVKRRKQHRRKIQEHTVMTGVYNKNFKWQAAIKVDKKQIHLGTFTTQEEATHVYDRAAFMCGRAPNVELAEEEKQELRKLKWDDFLMKTRSGITKKRTKKNVRLGAMHFTQSS